MAEKFYTTFEIAELLNTPATTVRQWVQKGKLGAVKVGRGYRIPQSQLDTFLRENSVGRTVTLTAVAG